MGSGLAEPPSWLGCHVVSRATADRAPWCRAEPTSSGNSCFPLKGESLEISNKPLPADCATKENTDVIQWTMRNPNLAQWSFWLCFLFQQLCTTLITFTGAAFAETKVCKGVHSSLVLRIHPCSTHPCLTWTQASVNYNMVKPTCTAQLNHVWVYVTALLIPLAPFFRNAAPNDVQGCLGWRQSCDAWGLWEMEGMEKPAPPTAGEWNYGSEIIHGLGFQSTHFIQLWASLRLVNNMHFSISAGSTLRHKGPCIPQRHVVSSSVQEQAHHCCICRCKLLCLNAAERGCKHWPLNP